MSSKPTSNAGKQASKPTSPSTNKKQKNKKNKKNKKKGNASYNSVTSSLPAGMAQTYINSLNDPFESSGCLLGWGCLIPTTIVTAYIKGTRTANADGTLALSLMPINGCVVNEANQGGAVSFATVASQLACIDGTAINANYSTGRVISGGIRAYPNIPMTAAPGACYVGSIPTLQYQQAQALTPNDLFFSPYMKQFRAYEGGTSVMRPQDTFSFEFDTRNVSTGTVWSGANDLPVTVPFIAFSGIGNGTNVFYEACVNLEVVALSIHGSAALNVGDRPVGQKMSDFWPSVEKLFSAVKPHLAAAGRYGAQVALGAVVSGFGSLQSKKPQMGSSASSFLSG